MSKTGIEWTRGDDGSEGRVWNPTRGCSLVSPGCTNSYAMKQAHRFSGEGGPYEGLTRLRTKGGGPVWTGRVATVPGKLAEPLSWRKPARIFVNSMSDLFHEDVPDEFIAAVFGVMAACPQHTFQVLTKRAERLPRWFEWLDSVVTDDGPWGVIMRAMAAVIGEEMAEKVIPEQSFEECEPWPLSNVHFGVSCEDQQRADERIPHLLAVPAAVRWVSAEPLLGPVDLRLHRVREGCGPRPIKTSGIDWIVVGGESGPGARPCDLAWIRSIVEQCKAAAVPVFVKQLGKWSAGDPGGLPIHRCLMPDGGVFVTPIIGEMASKAVPGCVGWSTGDAKGGDMNYWPADLRVREMPR